MKDIRPTKKITMNLPIDKYNEFIKIIRKKGYNLSTYFKDHITEMIIIAKK